MKKVPLVLAVLGLLLLTWHSAGSGYAALLTSKVDSPSDLPAVTEAVRLSPGDPRAQVLLGALLESNGDRAAANAHYQTAVRLRPDDHILRMQLARGQELAGDRTAAIDTATVAVTLAPFYAQPHWQLGNILVRAGRSEEGFSELRLAAASDPQLLPGIIDLAWTLSGGDVKYVTVVLAPDTPQAYKAFAEYYRKRGLHDEAVKWFMRGGDYIRDERRSYIAELIAAKRFSEADSLWRFDHPYNPNVELLTSPGFERESDVLLTNPGFEQESNLDEPGFDWRGTNADKALMLSLDNADPKEGRASLRVDFNGAANAGAAVLSQLVRVASVAANTHYRLSFAVRTENLVSGGLPNVSIVDATDNKLLGQTGALPQTTSGWQATTVDFTAGAATNYIRISLGRQPCPAPQCPIFGKLWLDDFRLSREAAND